MPVLETTAIPQQLPSPVPTVGRGPSHALPTARELVHKTQPSEVLVTDAARLGEDRFAVAALWPHDHLLYQPVAGGAADPTLLVETARQAAAHISHRFYDVPLRGMPFVLTTFEADIDAPGLPHAHAGALPVLLDAVCTRTTVSPGRLGLAMEVTFHIGGLRRGRARLRWEVMGERRYAILRGRRCPTPPPTPLPPSAPALPLPPHVVGRRRAADVLLAPPPGAEPDAWRLVLDRGHPVYFDHESDHIPGMVLLEAMRQAAHAATFAASGPAGSWSPLSLAVSFELFGALDAPVTVHAHRSPDPEASGHADFHLTATQFDRTLVRARLRGAAPSRRHAAEEAPAC
ncbi:MULTISPECIES: ScbA/BarX family gamma-butyrolactone biosynthesis protein [unclassified Streptomyces]|uniref:ScbA/BarX family gamma-butyrolactone biosynthesis protein n=1 Tax=Streptomyces sp. NPDC007872 TaxID=3364782 RepID=UPI0013944B35|nr:lactone biosynthesis protein, mmfl [Streptomyces sp. SID2131]